MTASADLALGDWIWAVFPQMTSKWRPGVFIARLGDRAGHLVVAVPATAETGHRPGGLAISEPPRDGLRPCRLLTPAMSVLRRDGIERLGAALSAAQRDDLEALIADWFAPDWRLRAARIRGAPMRLRPKSSRARRRTPQ